MILLKRHDVLCRKSRILPLRVSVGKRFLFATWNVVEIMVKRLNVLKVMHVMPDFVQQSSIQLRVADGVFIKRGDMIATIHDKFVAVLA